CARDRAYRSGLGHWNEYSTFDCW
nr:immunoglobulin heavy chain junction region [Macaca mulatta]MPN70321.1 immunoglobulin heavy chain junction region [Macaca mulatta]MPN70344.1 immunoglobulin heavy chain junction region [Macaca mulatta]MPN70645.1 immunoglobulin heavy chain junction region [Macaca mulatta]MPN71063.1 immunoglobulin heavy chain junction region [Macaca mulatta]